MVDWSEIEALQNELEQVQQENVASRLSDRNCVELVMKLKSLGLVQLLNTTNGKTYLTPERLEKDIMVALADHSGRAALADLATDLAVDYNLVEAATHRIMEAKGLILLQNQLISPMHIDQLIAQLDGQLRQRGNLIVGDICRQHDLPGDFVLAKLVPRLSGQLNSQKDTILTAAHMRRLESRLRGYLTAATAPLLMSAFYQHARIDEALFSTLFAQLTAANRVEGTLVGRGQSATFIPRSYVLEQTREIKARIDAQGHISLDELRRTLDLKKESDCCAFMGETFPHFKRLSSVFIADSYRQEILSQIRGDLDSEKLVDLISLVASSFTTADIDLLLEDVKLGECERLGDDWILTPNGLTHAKELFNALVNERADKAATKKVVTIITEDDVAKEDDEVKSVKVKKGPTGGGRGAREAKTKGMDKKRKKKEEEKEDSGGPLSEDEITGVVEDDELFSMLDEEARQALVDLLHPILSNEYQARATSIFVRKQQEAADSRPAKKSRREEEQLINSNYALLHLFTKALTLLEDMDQKDIGNIEKYLHKTVGTDLINSIFALTSDTAEKNLTQPMRAKILAQVDNEKAQQALKQLESAKTPAEVLELAYDAAELGAQMMIKFDKKRAASVAQSHLATQTETIANFTELPRTLHMGTTIVFGRVMGTPIHYPGKMSESLILAMQDKLTKEQFETLIGAQYDLVKMIAKEEVDIEKHITSIKQLVQSLSS